MHNWGFPVSSYITFFIVLALMKSIWNHYLQSGNSCRLGELVFIILKGRELHCVWSRPVSYTALLPTSLLNVATQPWECLAASAASSKSTQIAEVAWMSLEDRRILGTVTPKCPSRLLRADTLLLWPSIKPKNTAIFTFPTESLNGPG